MMPTAPTAPTPPALWVVRHAAPQIAPGTCYGMLDVPADPHATQATAQQLAAQLPQAAVARHSPLQRCEQLALGWQALQPDFTSTADARLCEMDFGHWEGRLWSDIDRSEIDAWTQDFAHYRPGQGENLAAMLLRVSAALDDAAQHLMRGTPVVWISHAGVARCVSWLAQCGSLGAALKARSEQWPTAAPGFGGWQAFWLDKETQSWRAAPQKG